MGLLKKIKKTVKKAGKKIGKGVKNTVKGVIESPVNIIEGAVSGDWDQFEEGVLGSVGLGDSGVRDAVLTVSTGGLSDAYKYKKDKEAEEAARLKAEQDAASDLIAKQKELASVEFQKATADLNIQRNLANRTIARELEAAARAGKTLDIQESSLRRDSDLLTGQLAAEQASFEFGQAELARSESAAKRDLLGVESNIAFQQAEIGRQLQLIDRAEGRIKRQGAIAAGAAQGAVAQAQNIAAASGFKSSALAGAAASAQSRASTQAGDILSGLVETELQRQSQQGRSSLLSGELDRARAANADQLASISNKRDLLSGQFDLTKQAFANQQAGIQDQLTGIDMSRQELAGNIEDINFNKEFTDTETNRSLEFLRQTYELGGDINSAANRLAQQQAANQAAAQGQANLIGSIASGATIGASAGPGGAIAGGIAGFIMNEFFG